jgi:hypothetical protein
MYTPGRAVLIAYRIAVLFLALALFIAAIEVVSIAVGLARHGHSLTNGGSLDVPVQLVPDMNNLRHIPAHVRLDGSPKAVFSVDDPTTRQMLLDQLQMLVALALFVPGLWWLRAFLGSVLDGDPFGQRNTRRLRAIGALLLIGAPIAVVVDNLLRGALFRDVVQNTSDLGSAWYDVPASAMLAGLGAFVLAEVFAYGMRLREDVEGTV